MEVFHRAQPSYEDFVRISSSIPSHNLINDAVTMIQTKTSRAITCAQAGNGVVPAPNLTETEQLALVGSSTSDKEQLDSLEYQLLGQIDDHGTERHDGRNKSITGKLIRKPTLPLSGLEHCLDLTTENPDNSLYLYGDQSYLLMEDIDPIEDCQAITRHRVSASPRHRTLEGTRRYVLGGQSQTSLQNIMSTQKTKLKITPLTQNPKIQGTSIVAIRGDGFEGDERQPSTPILKRRNFRLASEPSNQGRSSLRIESGPLPEPEFDGSSLRMPPSLLDRSAQNQLDVCLVTSSTRFGDLNKDLDGFCEPSSKRFRRMTSSTPFERALLELSQLTAPPRTFSSDNDRDDEIEEDECSSDHSAHNTML